MKKQFFIIAGAMCLTLIPASYSQENEGKVYGKVYADWYYNLSDDPTIKKKSEVEISRVYLGYKYNINENFVVDALLDVERANSVVNVEAGFDSTQNKISLKLSHDQRYFAYLKTAYLAWKNILPKTTLSLGQIPYFAFNVQEKFWGYRYIYKSFMDKQGWESSADMGASVVVAPLDLLEIVAGVVNGQGYKSPQDDFGNYKTALALRVKPLEGLSLYVYGDWMPEGSSTDNAQKTIAAFAGYGMKDLFKIGFEYNTQMDQKGVKDHNVNGISTYGMWSILKQLQILARFDMAYSKDDWNTGKDGKTVIAGLQYSPVSKVKFAADYQLFMPDASGETDDQRIFLNCEFDY